MNQKRRKTMETTDFCSYELSKALKACGFDEPCGKGVKIIPGTEREEWDEEEYQWCTVQDIEYYPKITLCHAQKWLREKKGIYAYCEPNCLKKWFARAIDLAKNEDLLFDGEMFDSFEKATEYAISAALELIKKGE